MKSVAPCPPATEVERIAALPDPVLRNLQITQCYHELAACLPGRTGPGANWCTFATWASKQAGQTIRQEDLSRVVKASLHAAPEVSRAVDQVAAALRRLSPPRPATEIEALVWNTVHPAAVLQRASQAVARGNLKVFAEIGWQFARFAEMCLADESFSEQTISAFCAALRPGEPPDGQGHLRRAFRCYYQVFFENDPQVRAELLLLANIDIGFHEQTRLQPEIAAALEAAVMDPRGFVESLLAIVFPGRGLLAALGGVLRWLLGRLKPLNQTAVTLTEAVRQHLRRIISEHLMTLTLPHGAQLRLGRDLEAEFPSSLQHLNNLELRTLLAELDPTPDSLRKTGATDWADLSERLHFIIDFFRCYQEAPDLLQPPFTPEQTAVLRAGRVPAGEL